jgi:hypothetical protein
VRETSPAAIHIITVDFFQVRYAGGRASRMSDIIRSDEAAAAIYFDLVRPRESAMLTPHYNFNSIRA